MNWSKLSPYFHIILMGFTLFVAIGFAEKKSSVRQVNDLYVDFDTEDAEIGFVEVNDVVGMINSSFGGDLFQGLTNNIELKRLEGIVKENPYVEDAQVYTDVRDNLTIRISQQKALARVVKSARDLYITKKGDLIGHSLKYTPRVLLLRFEDEKMINDSLLQSEEGIMLMRFLEFVDKDSFWKAQVAEVMISKDWQASIYGQVSKQKIEFGRLEDFEEKFFKIMVLYKRILPKKGWNTYDRVSVKFRNQIVCE